MIRINVDRILLFFLILSCVINGAVFECVFFAALILLIFRNRKIIISNKYYKWFTLISTLYIFLLFMAIFVFKTATDWRAIGIARNLCGISFCVLFSDKVCETEIEDIFIKYLIVFNLMFSFWGEAGQSSNAFLSILDYPGQNTLGALNMIALPHILKTYKGKMKILRTVFFISFVLFFINNRGFTTIFSASLVLLWLLAEFLQNSIRLKKFRLVQRLHIVIPVLFALTILLFFVNQNVQNTYLNFLLNTDRDRYTILSQAIYRITTASPHELLWGYGDNNYYMFTGRYVAAHNFIIEVIIFDGVIGLIVLILETFVFWRFMLIKTHDSDSKKSIMLSLILGYLFFLLHPVYTTSFLVKIYLLIMNLRACYLQSCDASVAKRVNIT